MNHVSKSNIFFSCTEKEHRSIENNIAEHVLVHIYSGRLSITDANGTYILHEGETGLFYKNMLGRFIKYPSATAPFKSIAIAFSHSFLQSFYAQIKPNIKAKPIWEVQKIEKHPLLTSLFDSILPYYEIQGDALPIPLTNVKLQEAIIILRTVDIRTDSLLANFTEKGKPDLVDFMQKNFMFNIPLERFAYLTGRSLATFKRDFQKAFNTSPQKWLLEKRLKEAHYQITEKNKKPSNVYLEVGFENLSHFSRAFKQYFGYTPSSLVMSY
jgi:AraC family transcriptional regulator, exoenzyme S synthesis regulatory protein ExsA